MFLCLVSHDRCVFSLSFTHSVITGGTLFTFWLITQEHIFSQIIQNICLNFWNMYIDHNFSAKCRFRKFKNYFFVILQTVFIFPVCPFAYRCICVYDRQYIFLFVYLYFISVYSLSLLV